MLGRSAWSCLFCILAVVVAGIPQARALEDADLYKAVAFVTGTEEPERSRGFRQGLRQVFVKLTGEGELANSPAIKPYIAKAPGFVASYAYEDRMKGIPVHDEQGTRERPHFLYITFDRAKLDAALVELGQRKWPLPRPRLAVIVTVRDARRTYLLTEKGEHGYGQREALKSAAEKRAIPIVLPKEADEPGHPGTDTISLQGMADQAGGDCPLAGALELDDAGLFWNMRWRLLCAGHDERWSLSGVSFDAAFAEGLARSARLLSVSQ